MIRLALIVVCLLLPPVVRMIHAIPATLDVPTETDFSRLSLPGRHTVSLRVDDRARKFIFVTPSGFRPGQPLPIVFFFHGASGTARQASRTYGWAEKAEKENFFAVFPEGLPFRPDKESSFALNPNIWRDERSGMQASGVNDVHFFEILLGRLQSTLPIDAHRICVTGFSNGAAMTFTLGGLFSNRIAAIAPVSSQSFTPAKALARPLPVYYLVGTADPLVLFHGGNSRLPWGNTRMLPPVQDSVDQWANLDGCPLTPQVLGDIDGVRIARYGPGRDNSEVLFTVVNGNGHHWPGTMEPLPHAISGPSLDPFNATDRIWEFFKAHPLP